MTTLMAPTPRHAAIAPAPSARSRRPALLAWAALLLVLGLGLPLFLCMPLTYDTVQYDLCVRKLLRGGVLYRDAFDNNLPGVIWIQAVARAMFGWRSEALRLADFGLISLTVLLLLRWLPARGVGAPAARRGRDGFCRFLPVFGRTYSLSARLLDAPTGGRRPFPAARSAFRQCTRDPI